MYVAYTAPHWPLHALPEDIIRYKGKYNTGWDKIRQERIDRMKVMGIIKKQWDFHQEIKMLKTGKIILKTEIGKLETWKFMQL